MAIEELELSLGKVRARVAPGRGALTTSLEVDGKELLFLDRESLENPDASIRGGIPIMFPFCSRLIDNKVVASGTTVPMHGFARSQEWEVVSKSAAALRLRMRQPPDLMEMWPWKHRLDHKFILTGSGLHLEMICINESDQPMPLSPGWHPYFPCPEASKETVVGSLVGTEPGHLHDRGEVNFGVPAPVDGMVGYGIPGLGKLRLEFSPGFRHFQIWSIPGRPFICLEPFWGPPNTLNTPDALIVPPGGGVSLWFRIER